MNPKLDFKTRLAAHGPDGAYCSLYFPFDFVKTFGTRARVPVVGTINGFAFRSSLMPRHGKYMMCINREMQAGANVKARDLAHFVMQRDDRPRTVTVPPALKKLLQAQPQAKAAFARLSYSHQKEHADWIAGAKQAATVQRRLEKLIPLLLAGKNSQP